MLWDALMDILQGFGLTVCVLCLLHIAVRVIHKAWKKDL